MIIAVDGIYVQVYIFYNYILVGPAPLGLACHTVSLNIARCYMIH